MSLSLCEEVRSLLNDVKNIQSDLDLSQKTSQVADGDKTLSNKIVQLQLKFQKVLVSLSEANLSPEVERQIRPCQTEGHRRLKLAGIAAMRLKTARQAETILERAIANNRASRAATAFHRINGPNTLRSRIGRSEFTALV